MTRLEEGRNKEKYVCVCVYIHICIYVYIIRIVQELNQKMPNCQCLGTCGGPGLEEGLSGVVSLNLAPVDTQLPGARGVVWYRWVPPTLWPLVRSLKAPPYW